MTVNISSDKFGNYAEQNGKKFYFVETDEATKTDAVARAEKTTPSNFSTKLTISDLDSSRMVYMFDYFYSESAQNLIMDLLTLDEEDNKPINIMINSPGGEISALDSIIDAIKGLKSEVNTVCLGQAASCGAVLFSLGKQRLIGKNSNVMIHELSAWNVGSYSQIKEQMESLDQIHRRMTGHLATQSGQNYEALEAMMKGRDVEFDPTSAVAIGLADAVLLNTEELVADLGITNMRFNSTNEIDGHISLAIRQRLENIKRTKTKGATPDMTTLSREQHIEQLNKVHNIDVVTIQAQLAKTTASLADMTKVVAEKDNTIKSMQTEKEAAEREVILEDMEKTGKCTQVSRPAFKMSFENMTVEQCKAFSAALPSVVNMEPEADTTVGDNTDEGTTDETPREALNKKVLAYVAKNNLDPVKDYISSLAKVRELEAKGVK